MDRTKELRDQIGRAHEAGEVILKEARENGWTEDRTAAFDKTHKELGELQRTLQAVEKQAEARFALLDSKEERIDIAKSEKSVALAKTIERDVEERGSIRRFYQYARGGWDALSTEDRMLYAAECRALGTTPDSAGGFLVPEEMQKSITEAILDFGGMRQARTNVMRTRSGNPLTIPQNDDTANTGEIIDENAAANELDPVFAEQVLGAFKYSSGVVRVSLELLNDNEIPDFEGFLGRMLGTRIGRKQNTDFTLGAGGTEPEGVVPNSSLGVTTVEGNPEAIGPIKNDLIDLIHSLDPGYAPNAQFMMNYATLGDIRKLDTTEGLPIWNDAQLNTPARLYGHEIIVNQDMAAFDYDAIPILFGDFSLYIIREVWPIRVTRTTELFWLESQVGLMALARADGLLNDAGTGPIRHMLVGSDPGP